MVILRSRPHAQPRVCVCGTERGKCHGAPQSHRHARTHEIRGCPFMAFLAGLTHACFTTENAASAADAAAPAAPDAASAAASAAAAAPPPLHPPPLLQPPLILCSRPSRASSAPAAAASAAALDPAAAAAAEPAGAACAGHGTHAHVHEQHAQAPTRPQDAHKQAHPHSSQAPLGGGAAQPAKLEDVVVLGDAHGTSRGGQRLAANGSAQRARAPADLAEEQGSS